MTQQADSITSDGRVLTITVTGPVTLDRVQRLVGEAYAKHRVRSTLWDLTQGDLSPLKQGDFMRIASHTLSTVRLTEQRRVAFLVGDAKSYIRMCEYVNEAFSEHVPAEYAVFREAGKARDWLLSKV